MNIFLGLYRAYIPIVFLVLFIYSTYIVKTLYNDAGYTANRIVILIVLLYIELRIRCKSLVIKT